VLGPDGRKMSKSRGNVINPDEIVKKFGADTLRMYEMFMGPFDQTVVWNDESLEGVYRFLKRVWVLAGNLEPVAHGKGNAAKRQLALLIKKVEEDLEGMKFNTAVAAMMEFVNWWTEHKGEMGKAEGEIFLKILAPMAPFITEELFQAGKESFVSIHTQSWPKYNPEDLEGGEMTVVIQVDGKVRGRLDYNGKRAGDREKIEKAALELENIRRYVEGRKYNIVFVPGKILNFILV
jgi:leucyl-tRNA synthetase